MDCVDVCPVDCFYEGENMLVIHPDECIDCGVCVPECPVDAIKPDTEPGLKKWLELNREYAQKWPNIPRTLGPTGTRPGNSTSTFRPSRVKATEQVHSGRYPMATDGTKRTIHQGPSRAHQADVLERSHAVGLGAHSGHSYSKSALEWRVEVRVRLRVGPCRGISSA